MRLTLRTMLCYLDDVLEPADAAELGKKIEESEYASQVVHRIRTSMRRLRLGAPKVSGDGGGYDANTVADYLDNTLPPEKVADFERVCLDPDTEVQLAEVAACHQILTLVLGEPAEVPQAMRQRIYDLAQPDAIAARSHLVHDEHRGTNGVAKSEVAAAANVVTPVAGASAAASRASHVSAPPAEPQCAEEADVAKRERHKPEVPAYLKEGTVRRSWTPTLLALALLAVGVIVGGILYSSGFFNRQPVAVVPPANDKLFDEDEPEDRDIEEAGDESLPADEAAEEKHETAVATDTGSAASDVDDEATAETPPAGETTGPVASNDDLVLGPADGGAAAGASTTGEPAKDPTDDSAVAKIDPPVGTTPPPTEASAALPLVDRVLGHYISTGQMLIALDPKLESWSRLASRAGVKPGLHLRSLPTYRPQILFDNGVQVTLSGDGELVIGNPTDDATPFVNMPYGRVMLATMSKAGTAIVVRAGERDAKLTFVNADAAVALEVERFQLPGVDPLSELPHVRATLSVTNGQVTWQEAGGDVMTLDAGQQLQMLDDDLAAVATVEAPKWIKSSDISDIDRRASATMEPLLNDGNPVEIKLEELCDDTRVEIRSLAMRSLASLERFESILTAFKDDRLKSYWSQHLDQLKSLLGHGAPIAAEIRAAAVRANGPDGESLFRLLWGYNPEQLKEGGAKHLVDSLKHSSMDIRVVAANTLRQITGKTQGYHPHLPEARRRTAEREWEQSLARGEIVYATAPPVLASRKPREMP